MGIASSAKAGAWTPANLSPAAWWDADDASTFTYSSGVVVSQWNDKSGNARHLSQATVADQPSRNGTINGKSAVVFDGISDRMLSTAYTPTKPTTLLTVSRNTDTASVQRNVITSNPNEGRVFRTTGNTIDAFQGAFLSTGVTWGSTVAHSVAAVLNDAASKIAADSGAWVTGTAGTFLFGTSGWSVAAYQGAEFWMGEICEIVHINAGISDADRNSWMAYAKTKWGTP